MREPILYSTCQDQVFVYFYRRVTEYAVCAEAKSEIKSSLAKPARQMQLLGMFGYQALGSITSLKPGQPRGNG